MEIME
jgi:hypothetical protein